MNFNCLTSFIKAKRKTTRQDKYALNAWDFKYDFKFIPEHIISCKIE